MPDTHHPLWVKGLPKKVKGSSQWTLKLLGPSYQAPWEVLLKGISIATA